MHYRYTKSPRRERPKLRGTSEDRGRMMLSQYLISSQSENYSPTQIYPNNMNESFELSFNQTSNASMRSVGNGEFDEINPGISNQNQSASEDSLKISKSENSFPVGLETTARLNKNTFPDFSSAINTNFTMAQNEDLVMGSKDTADVSSLNPETFNAQGHNNLEKGKNSAFDFTKFERLARNQSQGKDLLSQSLPNSMMETHFGLEGNFKGHQSRSFNLPSHAYDESIRPSVWSLDACDGLLVLGCSNGRIELWDISSGNFKVFLILGYPVKILSCAPKIVFEMCSISCIIFMFISYSVRMMTKWELVSHILSCFLNTGNKFVW